MKVRLTRWAMSPRTPQRLAHVAVELGLLLAAILGVVFVASGIPGHVMASGMVELAGALGGAR